MHLPVGLLIWAGIVAVVWTFRLLAKVGRAAQDQTARQGAVQAARAAALRPAPVPAPPVAPPVGRTGPPPKPPVPPPQRASRRDRGRNDAPSGLLGTIPDLVHEPVHARRVPALLNAFTHPHRLLAAIVVSEALRPPLSLRPYDQR
jgi:hypothetical protein